MMKAAKILGAIESRGISALGCLGIKVSQNHLVNVMKRQSGDDASIEAFHFFISSLHSISPEKSYSLLIPNDMHKALSFIRGQIGNPELMQIADFRPPQKQPDILLIKKEFLFQIHSQLKEYDGTLHKHFSNALWLILSNGTLAGGKLFSLDEFNETLAEAAKDTLVGYGNTVFSVRPGTNDYQLVREVAETYLPDIQNWISDLPKGTLLRIVDLGGHIGSFSIQINSLLSGNCEIHIYEPEPSNFAQIKKNISLNHGNNITPFNCAVSSAAGQGTLYFNPEHNGAHQLGSSLSYKTKTIPVEVETLETVFSKWGDTPVDILKIDVEGSEYNALFPASKLVKQCRLIVGEAQCSKEHIPQDMVEFLKDLGFKVTFKGDPKHLIIFAAINGNYISN